MPFFAKRIRILPLERRDGYERLREFPPNGTALFVMSKIAALLDSHRPGFALPGSFFTDDALYAAELDGIFARHWLFVASEPEIPEGGDYRTYPIGPYPVFILRQDAGSIVAFHNTCRHRGARVLQQAAGVVGA